MFPIPFPASSARRAGLIGAGVAILSSAALAQTPIGSATVVQNDVRGHAGGQIFRIGLGDPVILDQLVQTASNSQAKFVFLDTTNMSVGPDSIVKLDQFVYNGNGTAQTVSISATKGAFRFFSGNSEHRAYKVTTPQAVIGVRGTTYDVFIGNGQTYIKLQDGAVTACVRSGAICRDVDRRGDYLVVSDNDIQGPFPSNGRTWDFGSLCGGAIDLCNKTQFAMNNPPPPPPPSGGGFRAPPVRYASLPPAYTPQQPPVYVPQQPPVYVPPYRPPVRPPVVTIPPYVPPYVPPTQPPYDPCKFGYGRGCGTPTKPPPLTDTGCKPGYGRAATGCGPATTPPPNTGCNAGYRRASTGCGTGSTRPPVYPPYPGKPQQDGKPYPGVPYPGKPWPQQTGKPFPGKPYPGTSGTGTPYPGKPWPQQQGQANPYPGKPGTTRPPVEGRPYPGKPQTPPVVRFGQTRLQNPAGQYGAPNRFAHVQRMMQQRQMSGAGRQVYRPQAQAPRMTSGPRMAQAPRGKKPTSGGRR